MGVTMGKKNLLYQIFGFIQHKTFTLFMMLFFIAILGGCEELIVVNGTEPTINFQEGTIEGVKTGDDTTTVIQKLGKPDWIGLGDFDGFSFCYQDKLQHGVAMIVVNFFNKISELNPGDYRVYSVSVSNNYDGKSEEGIGIGTLKFEVLKKLGSPDLVEPDYNFEQYYILRPDQRINVVSFQYNDDSTIKSIGIETRNK